MGSMTWKALEQKLAGPDKPAVLVPLGAVEAHGPHLPLETDTLIATRLAAVAAERLAKGGVEALCAPPVPLSAASWAADFPGTVSLPEEAERALLDGVLNAVRRAGVQRAAFVNLHFDPVHVRVVRRTVEAAHVSGLAGLVFPDFTRRRHAKRIGGEFASGACHGGQFETSLLLAVHPEKVGPAYREMEAIDFDLATAIREGNESFRQVGLDQAYCGNPAASSAEEGVRLYGELAQIIVEECLSAWKPAAGS